MYVTISQYGETELVRSTKSTLLHLFWKLPVKLSLVAGNCVFMILPQATNIVNWTRVDWFSMIGQWPNKISYPLNCNYSLLIVVLISSSIKLKYNNDLSDLLWGLHSTWKRTQNRYLVNGPDLFILCSPHMRFHHPKKYVEGLCKLLGNMLVTIYF
jgi:hypothetical protein